LQIRWNILGTCVRRRNTCSDTTSGDSIVSGSHGTNAADKSETPAVAAKAELDWVRRVDDDDDEDNDED
jgi:hypothetical protein